MGKNDWSFHNPGHWEAPEDTTVSAGGKLPFHVEKLELPPLCRRSCVLVLLLVLVLVLVLLLLLLFQLQLQLQLPPQPQLPPQLLLLLPLLLTVAARTQRRATSG